MFNKYLNEDFFDEINREELNTDALDIVDVPELTPGLVKNYSHFIVVHFTFPIYNVNYKSEDIQLPFENIMRIIYRNAEVMNLSSNKVSLWYLKESKQDGKLYAGTNDYSFHELDNFKIDDIKFNSFSSAWTKIAIGIKPAFRKISQLFAFVNRIFVQSNAIFKNATNRSLQSIEIVIYKYSGNEERPIGDTVGRITGDYMYKKDINSIRSQLFTQLNKIAKELCPNSIKSMYRKFDYPEDNCFFEKIEKQKEITGTLKQRELPDEVSVKLRACGQGGIINLGTKKNPVEKYRKVFDEVLSIIEHSVCPFRASFITPNSTDRKYFRLSLDKLYKTGNMSFIITLDVPADKKDILIDYVKE